MTLDQFVAAHPAGSRIDTDGFPANQPYQCVDVPKAYFRDCFGIPYQAFGDAVDYYIHTKDIVLAKFDTKPTTDFKDGDVLVWGDDPGNWTGPAGHIGIWYHGQLYNQNYANSGKISFNKFFSEGFLGVLRPKELEMPIPDQDNYYGRYNKLANQVRGRDISRDEFRKYLVGQTDLRAIEILSDDPEADKAQNWQNVGKVAVTDNWQEQIASLNTEVKTLQTKLAKYENGDTVTVTRSGWDKLFDTIKNFFSKNN